MRNALLVATILSTPMFLFGCGGGGGNSGRSEADLSPTIGGNPPVEASITPIFDPTFGELPVPTDLQFASETRADGTLFVSDDTTNPVFVGIDALDGNSVISPFDIPFSGSIDPSSLDASNFVALGASVLPNPNQNVFLLPLTYPGGDSLLSVEGEVPTFSEAITYASAAEAVQVATAQGDTESAAAAASILFSLVEPTARAEVLSLNGGTNNVLRITPLKPLLPETKYLVVLTSSILDADGNPVQASEPYQLIRERETIAGLSALRSALLNWERLATGYFGFKSQVYSAAGAPFSAPSPEDIAFSITFTTGGTDSVITSVAAPEFFFEKSIRISFRQDAITKLIDGTYSLAGPDGSLSTTDSAINSTLVVLLTSELLPGGTDNPLFDEDIAQAIGAGAGYATIASGSASAAYLMQLAAAEAAISIHDSGAEAGGDVAPFVDIATQALGTVGALADGAGVEPGQLFGTIPAERETRFFRVDQAVDLNPSLAETAKVFQGQITLPSFQQIPVDSGAAVVQSTWQADPTIGAIIDAGAGNDPGSTPPSSAITYRYPFPTKQADVTVPLLAVTPDEALGAVKPDEGWPVIVFVHGIRQDRSNAIPMGGQLASLCLTPDSPLPCFATVAIDQPLHGVVPVGSSVPGLISVTNPNASVTPNVPADEPNAPGAELTERHFDFSDDPVSPTGVPQLMNYEAGEEFGGSGSLFINLTNFANVRDNLRQMNLDLLNLVASIDAMDVDGDGVAGDFDSSRIYLVGHSLGGISGTPFVATNNSEAVQESLLSNQPEVRAAAILKAGGGIPRLLINSQSFGPSILGGLNAASGGVLTLGSTSLETYLSVFQGILDSADPINFAASLSQENGSTGILLTEIIGDGDANVSDTVIPNGADADVWGEQNAPLNEGDAGAPLAGTEPLIAEFGAVNSSAATGSSGNPAVIATRFTEGSHSTPVNADNVSVFAELVSEIATFFALNGEVSGSLVTNTSVVESADGG